MLHYTGEPLVDTNLNAWIPVRNINDVFLEEILECNPGLGLVRNKNTGHVFSSARTYIRIQISKYGVQHRTYAHTAICATVFGGQPIGMPRINHKNHNTVDNRASNLEWCDDEYNAAHENTVKCATRYYAYACDTGERIKTFLTRTEMLAYYRTKFIQLHGTRSSSIYGTIITSVDYGDNIPLKNRSNKRVANAISVVDEYGAIKYYKNVTIFATSIGVSKNTILGYFSKHKDMNRCCTWRNYTIQYIHIKDYYAEYDKYVTTGKSILYDTSVVAYDYSKNINQDIYTRVEKTIVKAEKNIRSIPEDHMLSSNFIPELINLDNVIHTLIEKAKTLQEFEGTIELQCDTGRQQQCQTNQPTPLSLCA